MHDLFDGRKGVLYFGKGLIQGFRRLVQVIEVFVELPYKTQDDDGAKGYGSQNPTDRVIGIYALHVFSRALGR